MMPSDLLGTEAYAGVQLHTIKHPYGQFGLPGRIPRPEKVAVKIFEARQTESLCKEMAIYNYVDHPNIVKIFGSCQLKRGRFGLVMEVYEDDLYHYVESPDAKIVRPCGIWEARPILIQLADALKYLRRVGIVHRDVKPENILVRNLDQVGFSINALINQGGIKVIKVDESMLEKNFHTLQIAGCLD